MHALIIGAGGMIGRKLAERLVVDRALAGRALERLSLVDVVEPGAPGTGADPVAIETRAADIADPATAPALVDARPDVVFHLAAIVSGEAEADFEKGYRINLDGTRRLLEAVRAAHAADGYRPRLVYASSIAVFGAPFPEAIDDEFQQTPLTSYGTQKAIGELLLGDYHRRGFVDGVGLRLPTICIRPGRPNKAASGFFSNILREPIAGESAVLPVEDTVRHWFASPRAAVGFFLHAAALDSEALGSRRNLNMPGLSATVAEQIEALGRVVGSDAVALIRREPDPAIRAIVDNWPRNFDAARARALGFVAEDGFDEIIRVHLEDERGKSA